jgi:hypothetical protein
MTVWMAYFDTSHFDFDAFAATEKEALDLCWKGWLAHCRETGAERDYIGTREDISVREIHVGSAYRDRWEIASTDGKAARERRKAALLERSFG